MFVILAHHISFAFVTAASSTFLTSTTPSLSIFYHLAETTYHLIHGHQDCVVVLPWKKVRTQVMSPTPPWRSAVPRLLLCTNHQKEQDKASEDGLHRCSCRREKQMQTLREFYHSEKGKFHVRLITYPKHGETCCDTLTQTEVEQRHKKHTGKNISQLKKFDLTTRSKRFPEIRGRWSSRRITRSLIKTLWSGISHGITSWREKKSDSVRHESWDNHAGVKGGTCRRRHPWIEQTNSVSSDGNLPSKPGMWSFEKRESLAPCTSAKPWESSTRWSC